MNELEACEARCASAVALRFTDTGQTDHGGIENMRKNHRMKICGKISTLIFCTLLCCVSTAQAADQPNIVLVFMDNFGWGEPGFNGGGIIRGAPTLDASDPKAWRVDPKLSGGGVLMDVGSHRLDLLAWWFGLPEKIVADGPFGRGH